MKTMPHVVVLLLTVVGIFSSQGLANSTNTIAKWCGTVQNSDYLEIITRGQEHNRETREAC